MQLPLVVTPIMEKSAQSTDENDCFVAQDLVLRDLHGKLAAFRSMCIQELLTCFADVLGYKEAK